MTDVFEEFLEDNDGGMDDFKRQQENSARRRKMRRAKDALNEVGVCPPVSEEVLAKRKAYMDDFVLMHKEVYPDSTGVKPFGKDQEESIYRGQDIFSAGSGRLLKLEPRGYAKTTRITNEALFAVLQGMQDYVVILCSNLEKAGDILESMKTELYNNDQLLELYPGPVSCFRHLGNTPQKGRYQTYDGELTYIEYGASTLQFPAIPGEPSAGKLIEVRPLTNVKGLHKKIEAGPDAGKVFRPTLYIFDDPQTHDEATSETSVRKIISKIKRDALRGGSHSRRAAAIMSITPVAPGDVAWHFAKNEQSWDIVEYKMMPEMPDNHDWWMNEYAKLYLSYDRKIRGDRTRAAMEAKSLLEENWEFAHEGAEVTWDHAYGWDEEPQTEISPVQHAYNIILDDGWTDFEYECQCNIEYGMYEEGETLHAPVIQIKNKILPYRRLQIPQDTSKVVAHIDVNKEILSYVIIASPSVLRGHVIDYGTWPKQPGVFSKRNMPLPLSSIYPELVDYRERLYKGVTDLVTMLTDLVMLREDGVEVSLSRIGIDIKYEEAYVSRAIKESVHRPILRACSGSYVDPDDDLLHLRNLPNASIIKDNCYIEPNKRRTLDILHYDANFFKTELHKGFNLGHEARGSISLFGKEFDGEDIHEDRHLQFATHCNSERPERKEGKRKKKTRIVWEEKMHQADNEWFDNSVNCLALLLIEGVELQPTPSPSQKKAEKTQDMQEFLNQQKGKSLL